MYIVRSIHDPILDEDLSGVTRVFAHFLWEAEKLKRPTFDLSRQLRQKQIPLTLILNSWTKNSPMPPGCDVLYVDYFLWRTYNEIVTHNKSMISPSWNYQSKKFLFLTGKPQKLNRIGLLHLLHSNGLVKHALTSLFVHPGNRYESHKILSHLTDSEFDNFVSQYNSSPDNAEIVIQPYDVHYGGIPYDVGLFANTKFRVISETHMTYNPAWITEKTWITILNRQPFLIAGDVGTCAKLNKMGFKTFDEYLKTPYDQINNPQERLEAICSNIEHWLADGLPQDLVAQDIEHNYQQLAKLAEANKNTVNQYLSRVNIDATIDDIVSTIDDITNA